MTIEEIVNLLLRAKEAYYEPENEDDEPLMTDEQFDQLELELKSLDPNNAYFVQVGSEARGEKVKLPAVMGSLNQVYLGDIEKWVSSVDGKDETFVAMEKLDGSSVMLVYNPKFAAAFTRGDGYFGKDITRHVAQMNIPKTIDSARKIRGEIIIADSDFAIINSEGKYKNPRNYVAGQLNRSEADAIFYKYAQVVVYEVM